MRKLINRVLNDMLDVHSDVVILGEDIRHGGYYALTDGLHNKYPHRVMDFAPDETSLVGAALGFSQCNLTPIVEIPYAKYLECGIDIFNEAVMTYWLTNGREKNGMVVRLQGFDRGLFGGNFHTHNMLNIPPGLEHTVDLSKAELKKQTKSNPENVSGDESDDESDDDT